MPALKRGTPEHRAYMKALGAKGGRATVEKHPDHLKEIAAAGGRATKDKPKTFGGKAATSALRTPAPEGRPAESPAPRIDVNEFLDVDEFFASILGDSHV